MIGGNMYCVLHLPASSRKLKMDKVVLTKNSGISLFSVLKLKNYPSGNKEISQKAECDVTV